MSRKHIREDKNMSLEEYCEFIRKTLHLSFPINTLDLVQRLGIPVRASKIDQITIYQNEIIFYNKYATPKHINFAVAQELGKFLLKNNGIEFAAELLMPKQEFINMCINNPDESDEISLSELSDYFNVTSHAINHRGKVLGLWK